MDEVTVHVDDLRELLAWCEDAQDVLVAAGLGEPGRGPVYERLTAAVAERCDGCNVVLTGNHRHKKQCPYNWPNVRPSEWTQEQAKRARDF